MRLFTQKHIPIFIRQFLPWAFVRKLRLLIQKICPIKAVQLLPRAFIRKLRLFAQKFCPIPAGQCCQVLISELRLHHFRHCFFHFIRFKIKSLTIGTQCITEKRLIASRNTPFPPKYTSALPEFCKLCLLSQKTSPIPARQLSTEKVIRKTRLLHLPAAAG